MAEEEVAIQINKSPLTEGTVTPHNAPQAGIPQTPPIETNPIRQNRVSNVMLYGVPIVSLFIDNRERLCLAQISNTLLKSYSYNEIHNRRVALGITCVQCTPVQLEILRRAGAMPVSSRRCGMISKREAERLVKSFLEDNAPPKLPDNFAFDIKHECGWGCRGSFIPSRYNSSRAKCIKCTYCNMFCSPNKFIFHFHRMPSSKYNHPDAANFNSWRRHLKLNDPDAPEDLVHAWEDVKAMFNGGSRKRIINGSSRSMDIQESNKRPRLLSESARNTNASLSYQYQVVSPQNKIGPVKSVGSHPAFSVSSILSKPVSPHAGSCPPVSCWANVPENIYPRYEMLWAKHLGVSSSDNHFMSNAMFGVKPRDTANYSDNEKSTSVKSTWNMSAITELNDNFHSSQVQHISAFKPVKGYGNNGAIPLFTEGAPIENVRTKSSVKLKSCDLIEQGTDDPVDVETVEDEEDKTKTSMKNLISEQSVESKEQDMDDDDEDDENRFHEISDDLVQLQCTNNKIDNDETTQQAVSEHSSMQLTEPKAVCIESDCNDIEIDDGEDSTTEEENKPDAEGSFHSADCRSPLLHYTLQSNKEFTAGDSRAVDAAETTIDTDKTGSNKVSLGSLSKEELEEELLIETHNREKLEKDCEILKGTFQDQVERAKHHQEEMTKQLQWVKETLCQELEQERKTRFSLLQKLKGGASDPAWREVLVCQIKESSFLNGASLPVVQENQNESSQVPAKID